MKIGLNENNIIETYLQYGDITDSFKVIEIDNITPFCVGFSYGDFDWSDKRNPQPNDSVLQHEQEEKEAEEKRKFQAFKDSLKEKCEVILNKNLKEGYSSFLGYTIQADSVAQQNANGFLSAAQSGINIFPVVWRTKENELVHIYSLDVLQRFTQEMLNFVQEEFHKKWQFKDYIDSALTEEDAVKFYNQYAGLL